MAGRVSTLSLASPLAVARAVAGDDPYRFGTPGEGLSVSLTGVESGVIAFTSDGTLRAGDVYVAPLQDWVDYFIGLGFASEVITLILAALGRGKRAKITLSILGYVPFRLTIPEKGNLVFSPHGKIVLIGTFGTTAGSPVETWSASMSYDVVGPDVGAMPTTIGTPALEDVATAWGAVIASITSGTSPSFPNNTWLTEVAYYRAQADGTTTGGQWERLFLTTPFQGTGTVPKALQVAHVVTLDAQGPRGGRFGRFYLPALNVAADAGGRIPATTAADLCDNIVTALTTVNGVLTTAVGSDVELVVASGRGDGENRPVREVKVGRVPDTMRSRRTSLDEDYQANPFQSIP